MIKKELKDYIVEQLEDLKIEDIIIIDITKNSSLADYVIIGNGRSGKHIESSMANLKLNMKKDEKYEGGMISGVANDGWIVYDLGNIIVHLFVEAVRELYKLEQLFNPKIKIDLEKTIVDKKTISKKTDNKKTVTKKVPTKSTTKNSKILLKPKNLKNKISSIKKTSSKKK